MSEVILNEIIDLQNQTIINFTNNTGGKVIFEVNDDNQMLSYEFTEKSIKVIINKVTENKKIRVVAKYKDKIIYTKRIIIEKMRNLKQDAQNLDISEDVNEVINSPWLKKIKNNVEYSHLKISRVVANKFKLEG